MTNLRMFAVVACGRLVQTDFQQVDATKFVTVVPGADKVNHLVLFLTGQCPLPDGTAASVYLGWPQHPPNAPDLSWSYVGFLSNEKPSAIFRIARTKPEDGAVSHPFAGAAGFGAGDLNCLQVGLSLEPLATVAGLTPPSGVTPETNSTFAAFSQKMLESLINFLTSFAITPPGATESYVPVSAISKWYTTFERRLKQYPDFWKS